MVIRHAYNVVREKWEKKTIKASYQPACSCNKLRLCFQLILVDFAQILTEVAEEITASLPEWISSFNEGFYLESPLTNCLLRWEWLKAQDEKLDVFDFTQRIREWEEQAQHIELEQSAFFQFFTHLSETELEKIYKGLTAHRQELLWKNDLENIRSHWYEIYLFYLQGGTRKLHSHLD